MKQKISVAADKLTPKSFSHNHYTTLGFGNIFPIFSKEVYNNNKLNIKIGSFAYAAPTFVPTFSNLNIKLHAFYVPYRYVWDHFENFKEGLPSWNSKGAQVYRNVPLLTNGIITYWFTSEEQTKFGPLALETADSTTEGFDFRVRIPGSSSNERYRFYKFTTVGKQVFHILQSLGYRFNFSLYNYESAEGYECQYFSALPLLCFLKVFLDYYIPSQFQPSSRINQLFSWLHDLTAEDVNVAEQNFNTFVNSPFAEQNSLLVNCFSEVIYYYNSNYFTSAWQSPNEIISGLNNIGNGGYKVVINSIHGVSDNNDSSDVYQPVANFSDGTFFEYNSAYDISADGLSFLQKFARFIKRSNFAGSRSVERILARYGVRVDDFNIGMCRYLGSDVVPIQMRDVTVNGNTEQAGERAGSPFAAGNDNRVFKCDCDLAGQIIITAQLDVPSTPIKGIKREMIHATPLDFYTPELDGAQMQAISMAELYSGDTISIDSLKMIFDKSSVFGFTPRYSEYKQERDSITGDFNVNTLRQSITPYLLERRLFDEEELYNRFIEEGDPQWDVPRQVFADSFYRYDGISKLTPSDLLYGSDMVQFNRIFKDATGIADPFICEFAFNIVMNSSAKPLDESAELIGRGKVLDFEAGGKHL